jgi:hypothetical protein
MHKAYVGQWITVTFADAFRLSSWRSCAYPISFRTSALLCARDIWRRQCSSECASRNCNRMLSPWPCIQHPTPTGVLRSSSWAFVNRASCITLHTTKRPSENHTTRIRLDEAITVCGEGPRAGGAPVLRLHTRANGCSLPLPIVIRHHAPRLHVPCGPADLLRQRAWDEGACKRNRDIKSASCAADPHSSSIHPRCSNMNEEKEGRKEAGSRAAGWACTYRGAARPRRRSGLRPWRSACRGRRWVRLRRGRPSLHAQMLVNQFTIGVGECTVAYGPSRRRPEVSL